MLELDGLTRRFGDVIALDDLSFTVEPGRTLGFVGPNGAGKTTAMRIVLGVLEPDAGSVRWRGRPVTTATRARFGYMPEERGLYPKMRVREQLVYFARLRGMAPGEAGTAADRWIERLGLAERAADKVETLSLGNQQRVQLGVALVHDPDVLVLDEPFSGLDPTGVDVMSGVLGERAAAGVPVVFSSTSSTSSSGCARTSRSSTAAGWWRPARSRSCASAVAARSSRSAWSWRATATAAGSPACRAREVAEVGAARGARPARGRRSRRGARRRPLGGHRDPLQRRAPHARATSSAQVVAA